MCVETSRAELVGRGGEEEAGVKGPIGGWNGFDEDDDREGAGEEGLVVCHRGEDDDDVDWVDSCGMGFLIDLVRGGLETHDVRRIHSHERMS